MQIKKPSNLLSLLFLMLFLYPCYAQTVNDELLEAVKNQQWEMVKELQELGADLSILSDSTFYSLYDEKNQLYEKGDFQNGIVLAEILVDFTEIKYGKKHEYYGACMNDLALYYKDMGLYNEAEYSYKESLKNTEQVFGKNDPEYAATLSNLGNLYRTLGRYNEAESRYKEAIWIIENTPEGKNHRDFGTYTSNLALLYTSWGRYNEAEFFYEEALKNTRLNFGENHIEYARTLNNKGTFHKKIGQYNDAELLYKEAIKIIEKIPNAESYPDYGTSLNNLATLYEFLGRYNEAEKIYYEVIKIFRKTYDEDHPYIGVLLNNLAILYYSMGFKTQNDSLLLKADSLITKANQAIYYNLDRIFIGLSEIEKKQYLQTIDNFFEIYHSIVLRRKETNPSITTMSYNNTLLNKGMLLQSYENLRYAVQMSGDSALISIFDQFKSTIELKFKLQELQFNGLDSVANTANDLEKELSRKSVPFREQRQIISTTWKDVQQALEKNQATIEFIHFRYNNGKSFSDSIIYAALVIRPEDPYPQMIELFEEKTLRQYLSHNSPSEDDDIYIKRIYKMAGMELYSLIWQPLNSLLENTQTIYFSPSGLLNKIALDALPINIDSTMSDRFHMYQLFSTRNVVKQKQDIIQFKTATLFGGINYDTDSISKKETKVQVGIPFFDYMSESLEEVINIRLYMLECGMDVTYMKGDSAIEESVKSLDGKKAPDILHISTHGIYIEDTLKQRDDLFTLGQTDYQPFKDPMNRTGLVMARANRLSIDEGGQINMRNGILTANEISLMNLINTKLVVLSACDTGLGDIDGSEGVYGLQRAFKKAGVKYVMMSLGKVGARVSHKFMEKFYRSLLKEELSVRASFEQARQEMRKSFPHHPERWAPFVMIE